MNPCFILSISPVSFYRSHCFDVDLSAGIISAAEDSIFTYGPGTSFDTFNNPNFVPTFSPDFADPDLEAEALELCGGDSFCLFDVAATGSMEVGLSTLLGGIEFDTIVNISAPGELKVARIRSLHDFTRCRNNVPYL